MKMNNLKLSDEHVEMLQDIRIEAMSKELVKQIEMDYNEFIKLNPNGKEPEWILFIADKYK